jgi:uncharacterized membrane protein
MQFSVVNVPPLKFVLPSSLQKINKIIEKVKNIVTGVS